MSTACPTRDEINWFLRSTDAQIQADPRLSTIEAHVLGCQACIETMEGMIRTAIHPDSAGDSSRGLAARAIEVNSVDLAPQIEGFVVGDRIGRGGMGTVFKAWQSAVDREVAIKVLPGGPLADSRWRAWCLAEARAAARVRHADVVQIHNVGVAEGYPYLVMEYIAGGSLANRLCKHPTILPRDAARLLARVARAVHHMHLRGIIHRDLKPGNILIDSPGEAPASGWRPKVADFGLARSIGAPARSLTLAGIGTPEYMAPEQARGGGAEVGIAADVYALGAILYHLLVGRPPFQEASPLESIARVIEGNPTPPHRIAKRLPRDLETIVLKCLERDPRLRYASAETLADDLDLFLEGRTILARPIGPLRKSSRFARRHPVGTTLMIGLAITSAAAIGLLIRSEVERSRAAASEALALDRTREAERRRIEAEANRQEAEQMFEAAGSLLAIVGKADDLTVPRGEKYLAELEAVLPACRELIRRRPDDLDLIRTLGQIVYQLGRHRAYEGRPKLAAALFREGTDTLEAALAISLDGAIRNEVATLKHWYGRMLYAGQDFLEAIRVLRSSLELCDGPTEDQLLTPNQHRAAIIRANIGSHLIACGDELGYQVMFEAKMMLEGHLKFAPNDSVALSCLANLYYSLDEPEAALNARRRLVSMDPSPTYCYFLASTIDVVHAPSNEEESVRQRSGEIVELLESSLSEIEREADTFPGNPAFACTLHHSYGMLASSLLELGRTSEAVEMLGRFVDSIEKRHIRFPEPEPGIDAFYLETCNRLSGVLLHPDLPEETFSQVLDRIGLMFDRAAMTNLQRVTVLRNLVFNRTHAQTEAQRERIAATLDLCSDLIDRHLLLSEPSSKEIFDLLHYALACRVAGRATESETIVSRCGQALRSLSAEAKLDPEYHIALSEYWLQVSKPLWRHEPLDEDALREALRESLSAVEEAVRLDPQVESYRALLSDRRARLERSGLSTKLLAKDSSRAEVVLPQGR